MLNRARFHLIRIALVTWPIVSLICGCGKIEDAAQVALVDASMIVTAYGVRVDDPAHLVPAGWVDNVIDEVANRAMVVDHDEVPKVYTAMNGMTLHVVDSITVRCPGVPDGTDQGCINGNEIWIAFHACRPLVGDSAAYILAHEIGHAVGHGGHDFAPWFMNSPTSGVPNAVDGALCESTPLTAD